MIRTHNTLLPHTKVHCCFEEEHSVIELQAELFALFMEYELCLKEQLGTNYGFELSCES